MEPSIRNISDTALWVAVYRADESDLADAVFKDPFARELAGERGEQIVQAMESGRKNSWSFVARTHLFDEMILQQIKAGCKRVLNLASGLDTRPFRLSLPADLSWIDIDLPEITDYMQLMMENEKLNCSHKWIALDLSNREARLDIFQQLGRYPQKTLVVSEGLMGYLDEVDAGALAFDLSHTPGFEFWLLDIMSPGVLTMIKKEMGSLLDDANAPLKFAPADGEEFFRLFGWKPIESRSKLKTAAILKRLSDEMMEYSKIPEPPGPKRDFPWSGVCLFENAY